MDENNRPVTDGSRQPAVPPMGANFRAGLAILQQTFTYAQDSGRDQWDFALEMDKLYETGMSISDFRWLVAKGFALHAQETSVYGDSGRSFRPSAGLNFTDTTCFVLTPKGAEFAIKLLKQSPDAV